MHTPTPQPGRQTPTAAAVYNDEPNAHAHSVRDKNRTHRQIVQPRQASITRSWSGGEGHQKLKNRLIARGIPEAILDELLEQATIVNFRRGAQITPRGASTDLLFWVSSGLVDILCPGPDGEEIYAALLGPGELFGFVECRDEKGRPIQAFQARARTNVHVGLLIRENIGKLLRRQHPTFLIHILREMMALFSEAMLRYTHLLSKSYKDRLQMILADFSRKFGVKESRGTLLIPEFSHIDLAKMIGCSRPMISRLIAEMISAGSLAQDGKHYIIIDDSAPRKLTNATQQSEPAFTRPT